MCDHQLGLSDTAAQAQLIFLLFKPPCQQLKPNGQAAFPEKTAVSQQCRGENTSIHSAHSTAESEGWDSGNQG